MPTVLVVDDSAVDRRLVGGLLARSPDLHVEFAVNGRDALARIAERQPNVVVTDLVMPEMNGLELVSSIVERHPRLPVVLMTGKGSEDIAVQALKAGAASYVPKNSLQQFLLETVRNVLSVVNEKHVHLRLMECVDKVEFQFRLDNDADLIPAFINYIQGLVTDVGVCDASGSIRISIALEEALRNAMFHGNLEISSAEREGDPDLYRELLYHRRTSPPYAERQLEVHVRLSRFEAAFTIRDEGPGFDLTKLPDPTDFENLEKVSGRGLLLMRTFMDEVHYNQVGNQVTLVKRAPQLQAQS